MVILAWAWSAVWPYVVGVLGDGALGGAGWWLWRVHKAARDGDRRWRVEEERKARELSMAAVDAMSWQEFEKYVAELCRRDGCTNVVVSGRSGDLGATSSGWLCRFLRESFRRDFGSRSGASFVINLSDF
ncbi:restriction endonuclease [Streptomyces xiangluensis]|uniref:Restriction endonuclease n=1 Tax=Streptomyces xiangluensis TaxID=2665720 RepID=A0ABV8YG44_9ACTN